MTEKNHKDLLKPIYASIERLAPTNRKLIDFVNEKATGEGLKRSLYKVKFIDKSERSAKQLAGMTLIEFGKHLKEINLSVPTQEISFGIITLKNNILSNQCKKFIDIIKD